jgi:hypothetical protein
MSQANSISIGRLILIPGLITLGVTILRLMGELNHWSNLLFNPSPGGGGGLVGIVWLVPVFGIYFALKLASAGERPTSLGKAAGFAFLAMVVLAAGLYVAGLSNFTNAVLGGLGLILIVAGGLIPLAGWPQLGKPLIAYGLVARIPVAVVNFLAMRGNWGTHYDGVPPNFPEMGFWAKYIQIGLIPQVTAWVAFTVIVGSLFGIAATALFRRKTPAAATA